jgi:hypothetical protein
VRAPRTTTKAKIERMLQVSRWLSLRLQGHTLAQIGESQDPPISFQAVQKGIKLALDRVAIEPFDQIRTMELLRLDELLAGIYQRATLGEIAAIDRVLAIGVRRARLLGLDMQSNAGLRFGADGPSAVDNIDPVTGERKIRLEIINDPEVCRRERLYLERIKALGGADPIGDDGVGPKLN